MNKLLEINSSGTSIIISGGSNLLGRLHKDEFLYEYIPNVAAKIKKSGTADIILDEKNEFSLFKLPTDNGSTIGCRDLSTRDIISLVELLLERRRQENAIDCLHSSCAVYRGQAVVFFGGSSGMGKTRLMMELGQKPNACRYSDEKTLLDLRHGNIVGGNGIAQITKSPMREILGVARVNLNSDRIIYPLGLLVHAYVEDRSGLDFEFWGKEKAEWHLYEELTRKIRANSRRVKSGEWPVDGSDSLELATDRISRIKGWVDSNSVLYIRGGVGDIINKITELIDQKS